MHESQPVFQLTDQALDSLSPEGKALGQTVLMLTSEVAASPPSGLRLPSEWMKSWGSYLFRQDRTPAAQVIPWLHRSEQPELTLYQLCLQSIPSQLGRAQQLADAIHPLSKREFCLAQLELALHRNDEAAMQSALRAADAPPRIATGAEECQALGEALVRLSHTNYHPQHPAIQAAYSRLLNLARTRVEKDARSYEILPVVLKLLQAEEPAWRELAPPLIEQLHTPALKLQAESPPADEVPKATEIDLDKAVLGLEGKSALDRWLALRSFGRQLPLESQLEQVKRIQEDRPRYRCAGELAANWLDQDQLQPALSLMQVALLAPPEVTLWKTHQLRNLECRCWLVRGWPDKVNQRLQSDLAVDAASLRLLRLAAAGPLTHAHLQALESMPESHFYSGDPPSQDCLGASLAHLISPQRESWAAALFKGHSDPQRKALGAFLRERAQLRGGFDWDAWPVRLQPRGRTCPLFCKILAPWLANAPEAVETLDGLRGSDTNSQEALHELALERARQGNLEGCWQMAQRLKAYPLSQLCEALQGIESPHKLVDALEGIARKELTAVEKEILDRRLAQAQIAAGKPEKAWKTLPKLGTHNAVAAIHLAQTLLEWLETHPAECNPQRIDSLWSAFSKADAVLLSRWLPAWLPRLLAQTPSRLDLAYGLAERLGTPADQTILWLSLPSTPEHLQRALEQAEVPPPASLSLLEPGLRAALSHPDLTCVQKARFLRRLVPIHPRTALDLLEQLLDDPQLPTREVLAEALSQRLFPSELLRKATLSWAIAVLNQSPQPLVEWEQMLAWTPPPDPALARDLLDVRRLIGPGPGQAPGV